MGLPNNTLHKVGNIAGANKPTASIQLLEIARADNEAVLKELNSQLSGMSTAEAGSRAKQYGLNEIAREKRQSP